MEENRLWQAKWIWAASEKADDVKMETVYFRKCFVVPDRGGCELIIDVSADSRYRLFLNGNPVSAGPCKGDENSHYYDRVDLSAQLRSGMNVLSAQVVHYPNSRQRGVRGGPTSVWRSDQGALFIEGQLKTVHGKLLTKLNTDASWEAARLHPDGLQLQKETFTFFIGGGERAEGRHIPRDWQLAECTEGAWSAAVIVEEAFDPMYGQLSRWLLKPRPIPMMREQEGSFVSIVRGEVGQRSLTIKDGTDLGSGITLSPGERLWIEWDTGRLLAGYPRIELSGGAGAEVSILYSECYEYPPSANGKRNKGVRDEHEGKQLYGFTDNYFVAGHGKPNSTEVYEPFHRRAFRFIRLEITTGSEALSLQSFTYRTTGYPLDTEAAFSCSDETLTPLWEISLNTLRACMHETYEDTPYYEQMQYELDSRLQALFTYYVSGDDRLARKMIHDFHSSLLPSGMLQSRYPSMSRQVIPGFSLFWIGMVYDHYLHYADSKLVRQYRPTMDAVLGWFEDRIEPQTGLVGTMPTAYWSFVDWTEAWRDNAGAPPVGRKGPLTVYNLMYADALNKAAELHEWTDRPDTAREYRGRARQVLEAVSRHCWSDEQQLYQDGPGEEAYSQHAQFWAVLSGVATGEAAQQLMERMLAAKHLAVTSYAMSFYLFRALAATGLYERQTDLWEPWRVQVSQHLTAWVEDPVSERSDCHAWGAIPLYDFPAEILGVKPHLPGYEVIEIAPKPGELKWARGKVPTAAGLISVAWEVKDGRFVLRVEGPAGKPVVIVLPDGTRLPYESAQTIEVECDWS
jgi:alpha-L-rhamnosidase